MATEIPFNRNFEVNYGEIENVAPGIRRITANNPSPFTFRGTGTYILGEGNVAVIDVQINPNMSKLLLRV